jgi:hypothetical protein
MTPDTFEERLLGELRSVVAARPTPHPPPATSAPPRRSPRRPRLVVAGAGTAVAAVAAILLVAGGGNPAPAYAVERQTDGAIKVQINSLSDAEGLQSKLRALGIDAVVDYTPVGKMCRQPRGRPAPASGPQTLGLEARSEGAATFTIPAGMVEPGQTLVINASGGNGPTTLGTQVVEGPVAPCEVVDAPATPPATGGMSTGGDARTSSRSDGGGPSTHAGQ